MAVIKRPQLEGMTGFDEFRTTFPQFFDLLITVLNDYETRLTAGGL